MSPTILAGARSAISHVRLVFSPEWSIWSSINTNALEAPRLTYHQADWAAGAKMCPHIGTQLDPSHGAKKQYMLSRFSPVWLFATPWGVVHQAALSMGFSRQEYWSGLPRSPPGDLPDPRIELLFPTISCIGRFLTISATCKGLPWWFIW